MNSEKKQITNRAYEQRQKAKGIRIRSFRLSDEEWRTVKTFISQMRKDIKQMGEENGIYN